MQLHKMLLRALVRTYPHVRTYICSCIDSAYCMYVYLHVVEALVHAVFSVHHTLHTHCTYIPCCSSDMYVHIIFLLLGAEVGAVGVHVRSKLNGWRGHVTIQ